MTTATKKEVKGTPGVNASQNKTNGKQNGKAVNGTAIPAAKQEVFDASVYKPTSKPQTIEEQMKFFDGLAFLVKKKRVLEKHKEAIAELELPDEVNDKFSNEKNGQIVITLMDCNGEEYEITNAKLVQDTRDFLAHIVEKEITDCEQKIMQYGN